jgi:hypothetical protein
MTPIERRKIIKDFFDKADLKNIIVYKKFNQFSQKTQDILKNTSQTSVTVRSIEQFFSNPSSMKLFTGFNQQKFKISEIDSRRLLSNFILFHGLNYIEAHKLYLIEIINPNKKIGQLPNPGKKDTRKKVTSQLTLGQLISLLSEELNQNDFGDLYPKEFRNTLGHSTWWWKNGKLTYIDKNNVEKTLTYKQFQDLINEFDSNMTELNNEYIRRRPKSP